MSEKKTYIDLFAGCGGLSLGLFNSGHWKGKFAVESKSFKDFMNEVSGSGVDPIVLQLRKNINLKGNYTFEFTDGSKGKMSPGASEGILRKYDSLRRPNQKLNVSRAMGKNMKAMKDTLSNWDSIANKEDPKAKKSGRDEPLRGVKNPMDEEKEYKPHMMYDPKTGKGIMAKKKADHEKLKKQGYTHDDPSTKQIEEMPEAWVKTEADLEKFWSQKTEEVKATQERIKK